MCAVRCFTQENKKKKTHLDLEHHSFFVLSLFVLFYFENVYFLLTSELETYNCELIQSTSN